MNVGFISLGCAKNQVDTEVMMGILKSNGYKIVNKLEVAEIVIINTCGFITEAKEEAIDNILKTSELKKYGQLKYLIATGCLIQRYGEEIIREIPELDGIIGISSFVNIDKAIKKIINKQQKVFIDYPTVHYIEEGPRILSTPPGWAYVKIAEGCNNKCSYCAIPLIRGNLRSRPYDNIIKESKKLVSLNKIKELVIIAQDTTSYGNELIGHPNLKTLLEELCSIEGLEWIRLMYVHPSNLNEDIINLIKKHEKIVPYLDIPIQHASNKILQSMNRKHNIDHLYKLIENLKTDIKDIVLRTTVMLGYPGETQDDFNKLCEFILAAEFDWLGAFCYVSEEGTSASTLPNQIPEEVKQHRKDEILRIQSKITRNKNIARIDREEKILVTSRLDKNLYLGRGYFQAPDVDGVTIIKTDKSLKLGEFSPVKFKGVRNYDMIGEYIHEST
ncbi:Ribosomal protein S12p [Candidatus Syntrophocurvum alkaliphilum]|uniref:Ribosomal protein uS12 methylthiotransferase RimO n=1 Tax=Candidatus Syntrophocurvum alkaliphilum TaxID=2293317 RepID=A0A6I6DEK7_9FIRM|nr:30S ribosomal protein S12 methylthiotransferase RimO [Candidatus Syntrophocurvum alkaliphilum]QGT99646.1 Ribosomal protein S12p [Candidatus Syntrophocurvum alkaliphilum]